MAINEQDKKAVEGVLTFLSEKPVIVDVGSNKGQWADIVLERFGDNCKVWLFEPNRMLLDYTKIKYEYNENVIFEELALSNDRGVKTFYFFENYNNEISSLHDGGEQWSDLPIKEKSVTLETINGYFNRQGLEYTIDLLKIDVEGHDLFTLEGARRKLSDGTIKIVQIEYSEHWKRANRTFEQLFNFCKELGYDIFKYQENNYNKVETSNDAEYADYFITKFDLHNYSIKGWNQRFIDNTKDLPKFDFILEVGAFEGLTTKYICENMLNDGGRVMVVDPLFDYYHADDNGAHPYFKDQYQRFLRNTYGLPVELIRGMSEVELPKLNAFRYDFIYCDGDHRPEQIYHDCSWCFAILKIGGYLLIDDVNVWAEPTQEAVYKFLKQFSPNYEMIIEDYQVLIKKTGNQYNELTYPYYQ